MAGTQNVDQASLTHRELLGLKVRATMPNTWFEYKVLQANISNRNHGLYEANKQPNMCPKSHEKY